MITFLFYSAAQPQPNLNDLQVVPVNLNEIQNPNYQLSAKVVQLIESAVSVAINKLFDILWIGICFGAKKLWKLLIKLFVSGYFVWDIYPIAFYSFCFVFNFSLFYPFIFIVLRAAYLFFWSAQTFHTLKGFFF